MLGGLKLNNGEGGGDNCLYFPKGIGKNPSPQIKCPGDVGML